MNKIILFTAIVAIAVTGGYFLLKDNSDSSDLSPNAAESASSESVMIEDFSFNPSQLVIKAGDTVKWTNQDAAPHQINSDAFSSGVLISGASFEFKFTQKGTYNYFCSIHPAMTGEIIVE